MKKILLSFAVFAVAGAAYVGIKASTTNHESSLLLQNVEAMAMREEDDEWGCAGNPTFTKNESLQTTRCLGLGTHLKCRKKSGVCCDPSKQTDCDGLVSDILPW